MCSVDLEIYGGQGVLVVSCCAKNTSLSTFSGNSASLLTDAIFPAVLNSCSEGTDVATTHRYLRTTTDKFGYMYFRVGHHFSGHLSSGIIGSAL